MMRHRGKLAALAAGAAAFLLVPLASAVPPGVSIDGGVPSNPTTATSASISFSSPDPLATFECGLGGLSSCSSPFATGTLSDGTYTFTVRATNVTAETSETSATWRVDTTGPALTLPNVTVNSPLGTPVNVSYSSASASDPSTPVSPLACTPSSGSSFSLGTSTVSCNATDGLGNSSNGSFSVTVQDTTAPVVTVPGNQTVSSPLGTSQVVTWSGVSSNEGTPTCVPASGTSFPLGTTTVTCTRTDGSGNTGSASFNVIVQDITDPVVTVPGNQTASVNGVGSAVVTWSGVSSNEGTPTCVPASGSSFPLGTTTVTCSRTDASGNTGSASFTVTVQDTTAPTVTITSGPSGTVGSSSASFSFTTNEGSLTCSLDSGGFSSCSSPAAYSGLGGGAHTFRVRATDLAGNTATATRTWTIDLTPPVITVPGTITVEANGPAGSTVTYSVTASDGGVPLLPGAVTCTPASGGGFPLGTTTVTCNASDAFGNAGTASFDIVVVDTTAPTLTAADVTLAATIEDGIRRGDPAMAAYLRSLSATDLVSRHVVVTTDAPDLFPVGKTRLRVTAKDAAGNQTERTVTVTVLALGKPAPPPPDLTPPADVTGARAIAGDHRVELRWAVPPQDGLAAVEIAMSVADGPARRVVYRGLGRTATVAGLDNDVRHRFLFVSVDKAGNRSRGVVVLATPRSLLLAQPKLGAKVTGPPLLRWTRVPGASYFNVQLFRGKTKLLSAWPLAPRLQLQKTWKYDGLKRTLAPGVYVWYVWPGLGNRAETRYGPVLGKSTFTVVAPKKTAKG